MALFSSELSGLQRDVAMALAEGLTLTSQSQRFSTWSAAEGAIKYLVSLLHTRSSDVWRCAAAALHACAIGGMALEIVAAGGIPPLVQLASHVRVQVEAACALQAMLQEAGAPTQMLSLGAVGMFAAQLPGSTPAVRWSLTKILKALTVSTANGQRPPASAQRKLAAVKP